MFENILVVCIGNICRSPTAEQLLKSLLPTKNITSAGLAAMKGHSADKTAMEVADNNYCNLQGHIAKQLTQKICSEFDLILVMEKVHIDFVTEIAPEARGKTMLLSHWSGKNDIPDPYRQSKEAFEHAYTLISDACGAWAKKLS